MPLEIRKARGRWGTLQNEEECLLAHPCSFETFFESVGMQPHPLSILNEEASVVERLKRSRICGISPSSLVAHTPSRGVEKNSVEDNLAARRTVSPGKAWVFVLLQERHSESLVIEKRDSTTHETVVAKISFGDWRKIAKRPQVKR